jgi:hypothetical protein
MKQRTLPLLGAGLALALFGTAQAHAASANLDCKLKFSLTGWSLVFKHAEGHGTVSCENGESMAVDISAKGGGITVGKSHIDNGHGRFTDVHNIREVLGNYAQANANAALYKSGEAQVLTKGPVSLALAGSGEGVALGVDIGTLHIDPAR